ncbi:unnamed protein product [Brassica oleracea]
MDLHGVLSDINSLAFSPSSSFWVRFELKLYGTVIVCIDTMLFDVKDNLDYLLHEFIAVRAGAHERQERYDEQEEEEEKQSKFEQKRKESVKKKAKRESISNAEEEDNEEKEITEDATENIDTCCCFNDLDSPVNKAGSAGRLKAVYVRTEHGVLFEVFSSYNKNLQAVRWNHVKIGKIKAPRFYNNLPRGLQASSAKHRLQSLTCKPYTTRKQRYSDGHSDGK